jgi:hypothetical protein
MTFFAVLIIGFSITTFFSGMFEMMRTGFTLTLHMVFAFLTLIAGIMVSACFDAGRAELWLWATLIFAILTLLTWMWVYMFRKLLIFRSMQWSSLHMSHLNQMILLLTVTIAEIMEL